MEILSPKERIRLEKKAKKTQKKINRIFKKKLKGWKIEIGDEGIILKKDVWVLDLKNRANE